MFTGGSFTGGKIFRINTRTKEDLLSKTKNQWSREYLEHNMVLDESVRDWYVIADDKEIRVYKIIPHLKRVIKDYLCN